MPNPDLLPAVADVVRDVGDRIVRPRAGGLTAPDIGEKSPGEVVTAVDLEAEAALVDRLRTIRSVPVIGEESVASDPTLLQRLTEPAVWVVDPVDGTANFIEGSADYAVMVALVEHGVTVASWMYRPADQVMLTAVQGGGAFVDETRVRARSTGAGPRGILKTRFLPPDVRAQVDAGADRFDRIEPGANCTAVDYPRLTNGELDFILYWRTLPWDHAPGTLFLREAGGIARRVDGTEYEPGRPADGLLVATDPTTWSRAHASLFAPP